MLVAQLHRRIVDTQHCKVLPSCCQQSHQIKNVWTLLPVCAAKYFRIGSQIYVTHFRQYKEYMNIPSSDELHCNAWKLFLDLLKGLFNYRLIFNSSMTIEESELNLLKGLKCHDAFTAKKR